MVKRLLLAHGIWLQFYFSSFRHDILLTHPLRVLSHLRPRFAYSPLSVSTACAEPRRASARRVEALLVYNFFFPTSIREYTQQDMKYYYLFCISTTCSAYANHAIYLYPKWVDIYLAAWRRTTLPEHAKIRPTNIGIASSLRHAQFTWSLGLGARYPDNFTISIERGKIGLTSSQSPRH